MPKTTVVFCDWSLGSCAKQLGRLGISTGDDYELSQIEISSMIFNLLGSGMAVRIRPYVRQPDDKGLSIAVDVGSKSRPFS